MEFLTEAEGQRVYEAENGDTYGINADDEVYHAGERIGRLRYEDMAGVRFSVERNPNGPDPFVLVLPSDDPDAEREGIEQIHDMRHYRERVRELIEQERDVLDALE